jgi:hypothetical protein
MSGDNEVANVRQDSNSEMRAQTRPQGLLRSRYEWSGTAQIYRNDGTLRPVRTRDPVANLPPMQVRHVYIAPDLRNFRSAGARVTEEPAGDGREIVQEDPFHVELVAQNPIHLTLRLIAVAGRGGTPVLIQHCGPQNGRGDANDGQCGSYGQSIELPGSFGIRPAARSGTCADESPGTARSSMQCRDTIQQSRP